MSISLNTERGPRLSMSTRRRLNVVQIVISRGRLSLRKNVLNYSY